VASGLVYIVIGRFTEALVPVIHISVYDTKQGAHAVADRVGGIVVARRINRAQDDEEEG